MENADKIQFRSEIRCHLKSYGSRHWTVLRSRWASVPSATWWRAIAREKARIGSDLFVSPCRQKRSGQPVTTTGYEGQQAEPVVHGIESRVGHFDFLAAFRSLFSDALMLREYALYPDGRLRNPAVLDRAIRIRCKLVQQGVELEHQIFSVRAQRRFYDALVSEIADESPELHKRLISRLRAFRSQFDAERSGEVRDEGEA